MHWIIKAIVWLLVSLAILVAGVIAVNSNIKASVDPENVSHTSRFQDGKFHNEYQFEQPGVAKFLQIIKRYITEPATDKQPVQALPLLQVTREMLDRITMCTSLSWGIHLYC